MYLSSRTRPKRLARVTAIAMRARGPAQPSTPSMATRSSRHRTVACSPPTMRPSRGDGETSRNAGTGASASLLMSRTIGFNYRLSNICAAIGLGQLRALDLRVQRRRNIFSRYVYASVA